MLLEQSKYFKTFEYFQNSLPNLLRSCWIYYNYSVAGSLAQWQRVRLLFVRLHVRNRAKSHLCTCMWGSDWLCAGCQEVGKCSTRGESLGMYITFASAKIANKAEPTLALKPRGDVTRNPKQGYQWPLKGHVSAKNFFLQLQCTELCIHYSIQMVILVFLHFEFSNMFKYGMNLKLETIVHILLER